MLTNFILPKVCIDGSSMADVHSREVRSFNMSRIRSKDTSPEMLVRKFLHSKGLRFRIHSSALPGKPDMVFPKFKTAVFINGCFWHGHEVCGRFKAPKSNTEYWGKKIFRNKERDSRVKAEIKSLGWRVLTIWECELKNDSRESTLTKLYKQILN